MPDFLTDEEVRQAQASHIPVDSHNPGTYWIISLDRESAMPSEKELARLRSYQEFLIRRVYNETYVEQLLAQPLPKCGGHNTTIFMKSRDRAQGWFYRKMTWTQLYHPPIFLAGAVFQPLTLAGLLDRIESFGLKQWAEWKAARSEIFADERGYRVIRVAEDYGVVVVALSGEEPWQSDAKYFLHNSNLPPTTNFFEEVGERRAMGYFSGIADGLGRGDLPGKVFQELEAIEQWAKEKREEWDRCRLECYCQELNIEELALLFAEVSLSVERKRDLLQRAGRLGEYEARFGQIA